MKAVVNSTPLVALSLIRRLSLLDRIFDQIFVPTGVYEEVVVQGRGLPGAEEVRDADWITVREPRERPAFNPALLGLDRGEWEVMLLAQEVEADWVIVDERLGRQVAEILGFQVKGTLGVLLTACYAGLISREEAEQAISQLEHSSIRMSDRLIQWFREELDKV